MSYILYFMEVYQHILCTFAHCLQREREREYLQRMYTAFTERERYYLAIVIIFSSFLNEMHRSAFISTLHLFIDSYSAWFFVFVIVTVSALILIMLLYWHLLTKTFNKDIKIYYNHHINPVQRYPYIHWPNTHQGRTILFTIHNRTGDTIVLSKRFIQPIYTNIKKKM